jgi:hypothetical protein
MCGKLDLEEILEETQIVQLVTEILKMDGQETLIHYSKLESVWIIVNLFFADEPEINVMLGLSPSQGNYHLAELGILSLLNKTLNETTDLRMVTLIYFAFGNLIDTSKDLSSLVQN